jgi:hypothetical protein
MDPWYWKLIYVSIGAVIGAFAVGLCAMARCSDCQIIGRIWSGGKKDDPYAAMRKFEDEHDRVRWGGKKL